MKNNIKVKIEFLSNESDEIIDYNSFNSTRQLNNISNVEKLNTKVNNQNPFLLGISKLDGFSNICSQYEGAIIKLQSYSDSVVISFNVENLDGIFILFDKHHAFPKIIRMSYSTENKNVYIGAFTNDNDIFSVRFDEKITGNLKITINGSNLSYNEKVLVINAIYTEIIEEFTNKNISNLILGRQISSDIEYPEFCFIGNYGSFDIIDNDGKIEKYNKENMLNENNLATIYFNDNIIGKFKIQQWWKNEKDKKYNVELQNGSNDIKNIVVNKIVYEENVKAIKILEIINSYLNKKISLSNELLEKLNSINIENFYHEKCSLLELINDFCNLTMTCISIYYDRIEVFEYV